MARSMNWRMCCFWLIAVAQATVAQSSIELRQSARITPGTAISLSQVARLTGQAAASGAAGRAFWSQTHGLVVVVSDLPPQPDGRPYRIWIADGRGERQIGQLSPDAAVTFVEAAMVRNCGNCVAKAWASSAAQPAAAMRR